MAEDVKVIEGRYKDITQWFHTDAAATAWREGMTEYHKWLLKTGLLRLVCGNDPAWGRQGLEHPYYNRDPSSLSFKLAYRRAKNYIEKWKRFSHIEGWPVELQREEKT